MLESMGPHTSQSEPHSEVSEAPPQAAWAALGGTVRSESQREQKQSRLRELQGGW